MTVYVDDWGQQATVGRLRGRWSHLVADTREELHAFAASIGLRREWFQDHPTRWHYDAPSYSSTQCAKWEKIVEVEARQNQENQNQ